MYSPRKPLAARNEMKSEEVKARATQYCTCKATVVRELKVHRVKLSGKSEILTELMLMQLGTHVTLSARIKEWDCVFTIAKDGTSMRTFYSKLYKYCPTILIIKDTKGRVFGAYVSEKWKNSKDFYGTGETFLFSFNVFFEITLSLTS